MIPCVLQACLRIFRGVLERERCRAYNEWERRWHNMNPELQEILDHTQRMVFFGGAGVSTASGIPDFRSPTGLYSQKYAGLTPEMILSRSFFYLHPEIFFEFYRSAMLFPQARPNVVHTKLAALETTDRLRGIVTQNIDGLHREAGNIRVYEVHGSVHENVCMDCGERFSMQWMAESTGIPRCTACGGVVKPGVVLYGEAPDRYVMMGASREISEADTLIVAGTSLSVEPAASLIRRFRGRNMVVINREPVPGEENAGLVIHAPVEDVFSDIRIPSALPKRSGEAELRVRRYRP